MEKHGWYDQIRKGKARKGMSSNIGQLNPSGKFLYSILPSYTLPLTRQTECRTSGGAESAEKDHKNWNTGLKKEGSSSLQRCAESAWHQTFSEGWRMKSVLKNLT
eukprot:1155072-Pelagomonas_calceolata.AAC.3